VLAEWVRDKWRAYGLEQVEIVRHDVLRACAADVRVEMTVARLGASPRRRGGRP
jgi:hypothetical protein